MKKPTHFIEVWKGGTSQWITTSINKINILEICLNNTIQCGFTTIAIFKIYRK